MVRARKSTGWSVAALLLWSGLIAGLLVPSLRAPFDFVDDGNLVYPAPPMPAAERLHLTGQKIVANYEHLGPFRPVLWVQWEAQAEICGGDAFCWRLGRLIWAFLAAAAFFWLLWEVEVAFAAAVITVALAMWNPYRAEVWRSLTLSEGVAMPYALAALACAARARRDPRWRWDVGAALCALAALGCKTTFAALIPAQLALRLALPRAAYGDSRLRAAVILTLPLLLPLSHVAAFVRAWHPGQYELHRPSRWQLGRMLRALWRGTGLDLVGIGLVLSFLALCRDRLTERAAHGGVVQQVLVSGAAGVRAVWRRSPSAALAGATLLVAGTAVYLPIGGVEPRYSMPAVWGADLWIGLLLSELLVTRPRRLKQVALATMAVGVIAVAVVHVARQERSAARAAMLWQIVHFIERNAAPDAVVAWVEGSRLGIGEGIHFFWHLRGRGRADLHPLLLDATGQLVPRPELRQASARPAYVISGSRVPPAPGAWGDPREFSAVYWTGLRAYRCFLWSAVP